MAETASNCRHAADRLHEYLLRRHIGDDGSVTGPDVGVRLNLRVWRFAKSYLGFLPWSDTYYYCQGQAYWIFDNIEFHKLTGDKGHLDSTAKCADVLLARQTSEGYWEYPHSEWKGVIATVETCFGGLGLLAAYDATRDERYLFAAIRTYDYVTNCVGFQRYDDESLAVNYFSNRGRGLVPNNSTLAVWFFAALSRATGEARYLDGNCKAMVNFLIRCQLDSGELPYSIVSEQGKGRDHYQCFQYNSFQFMDMVEYHALTNDDSVLPMMRKLADFLSTGLTAAGDIRADCEDDWPIRHYCTAAISAALTRATQIGLSDCAGEAARGFDRLISWQRRDGGFGFSTRDYGFLTDRRSYPRVMCMALRHLLVGATLGRGRQRS